jgi:hypothetical protein
VEVVKIKGEETEAEVLRCGKDDKHGRCVNEKLRLVFLFSKLKKID